MTKTYTLNEVMALQNERQQLEQRLSIHKQKAEEKQKELNELFAKEGVSSYQELSQLCEKLNIQMQQYAAQEEQNIKNMKELCDELDRTL